MGEMGNCTMNYALILYAACSVTGHTITKKEANAFLQAKSGAKMRVRRTPIPPEIRGSQHFTEHFTEVNIEEYLSEGEYDNFGSYEEEEYIEQELGWSLIRSAEYEEEEEYYGYVDWYYEKYEEYGDLYDLETSMQYPEVSEEKNERW